MPRSSLSCFAVTAPGLEQICSDELRALGIRGKAEDGGVAWSGTLDSVAKANLWLRTASRVLVRIAEFRATAFYELELHAKRIAWSQYVAAGTTAEFRVTCRKSKLYHSDAVAERFMKALEGKVKGATAAAVDDADDEETDTRVTQLFIARFVKDVCTVSADTSGALLHRRGYRQQLAKAPLRETLAAAVLLGAGWKGDTPLLDPMCGSGTIPIEGAMIARRMAPGRNRSFSFLNWPGASEQNWTSMLNDARSGELPAAPVLISGSDRDDGAIAAARANAERAGVLNDLDLRTLALSAVDSASAPGLIALNPPYGVRIGDSNPLRNLYARLGDVVRTKRQGWTLALLSADKMLERQIGLRFEEKFHTKNGGIPVRLVVGTE
ncbi:MAG: class I SAM-dependent RNA methyltransferase [Gemmatimonadaceae bacterium]